MWLITFTISVIQFLKGLKPRCRIASLIILGFIDLKLLLWLLGSDSVLGTLLFLFLGLFFGAVSVALFVSHRRQVREANYARNDPFRTFTGHHTYKTSRTAWTTSSDDSGSYDRAGSANDPGGIEDIDGMDGWSFETRMRQHFETMGWRVTQTPGSGDHGADLVLVTPDHRTIVVQLKRYRGPVGQSAVWEVLRAKAYYHADLAMVITNSHLTAGAKSLAQGNGVDVWEREELIRQLEDADAEKQYQEGRDAEEPWTASTSLPDCFRTLFFDSVEVTEADVLARYRKLTTVTHPDVGGSHESFIRLQRARDECLEYLKETARNA